MKNLTLLLLAGLLVFTVGCSKKEENKTPDEVRAEAQKMTAEDLQAKVDAVKADIAAKSGELAEVKKEQGGGLLGGEKPKNADELAAKDKDLTAAIAKLNENLKI